MEGRTRHDNIDPAEDRFLLNFNYIRVKEFQRKQPNSSQTGRSTASELFKSNIGSRPDTRATDAKFASDVRPGTTITN